MKEVPHRAGSRYGVKNAMEVVWILGFIAVWFVLQLWVLPRMGVPT